ncbi:hypothetical protein T484DRAFT_1823778 [Baffinella frigidus]|nr:hypothetical protein T484DRAFT_1823778 [Cryptophyta sp. CCMP2293]
MFPDEDAGPGWLRVTTTTTTFLSHTFTYGDAPLMQKVCPNSCDVVGTCEALPPPPADCCNAVLFDAAFTHLGVGPRFECPTPKNTTATCDHEPTALKEVSVAAGGRVTLRSGGGVAIPANALAGSGCPDPCPIMVSPATSVAKALAAGQIADSNPAWEDVALVSAIYDLAPSGITFAAPVTVCLSTAGAVDVAAAEIYQIAVVCGICGWWY